MPAESGFIIAAPSSGSGKTTVTLALLRALADRGHRVVPAKCGPDYIDPVFLEKAARRKAVNLDPFAMDSELLSHLVHSACDDGEILVVEGVMGLFDGGPGGAGSTADLARALGLPIILVLNAQGASQSLAAVARGFAAHDRTIRIAGVLLNNIASERHLSLITKDWPKDIPPVIGAFPRNPDLHVPGRHLGLVQADELENAETFIASAAESVNRLTDTAHLLELASPPATAPPAAPRVALPPPGQRIAIARDNAFRFAYPHILGGWQDAGASLSFFSPLDGDAADPKTDAIFLPGGYPELHGAPIAANSAFLEGLRNAASRGIPIYGECGGYMVLGEAIIDRDGRSHRMAGLLPVVTGFETPKRHLGYRIFEGGPGGPLPGTFRGHEFHYSRIVEESGDGRLFQSRSLHSDEASGIGHVRGSVFGSYGHIIAAAPKR